MIEMKIPKEIRVYKEKFLFGLTFRQTVCAVPAILVNIPLYLFLSKNISSDFAGWVVMITATPLALIGFVKYNGMHFEKLIACIFWFSVSSQKRPYKTENLYTLLAGQCKKEKLTYDKKKQKTKRKGRKKKIRTEDDTLY